MKTDYRLYLVTEESVPIDGLLSIVDEAIKGGVTMVQLREKRNSGRIFLEKAVRLKELTNRYHIPLIINDRVDIAMAAGADGVHVGQQDQPLTEVKKIISPSMIVGVSAGTIEEALDAERDGADYIGVGAVFPTASKDNAKLLSDGMLERIVDAVTIPVVAIGGIKYETISTIRDLKIAGIAVVSQIMNAQNPYEAANQLREELGE